MPNDVCRYSGSTIIDTATDEGKTKKRAKKPLKQSEVSAPR